jgi:hypothetical protein
MPTLAGILRGLRLGALTGDGRRHALRSGFLDHDRRLMPGEFRAEGRPRRLPTLRV